MSARYIAVLQGAYYLVTGMWPLLSMGTFLKVTGPKRDLWLVKTVGGLVSVIGGVLLFAGLRNRVERESALLGAGSAAVLTAVDVTYVLRGRISPVYLLDVPPELGIVASWLLAHPTKASE